MSSQRLGHFWTGSAQKSSWRGPHAGAKTGEREARQRFRAPSTPTRQPEHCRSIVSRVSRTSAKGMRSRITSITSRACAPVRFSAMVWLSMLGPTLFPSRHALWPQSGSGTAWFFQRAFRRFVRVRQKRGPRAARGEQRGASTARLSAGRKHCVASPVEDAVARRRRQLTKMRRPLGGHIRKEGLRRHLRCLARQGPS